MQTEQIKLERKGIGNLNEIAERGKRSEIYLPAKGGFAGADRRGF